MFDQRGNRLKTVWILGAGFSRSLGGPLLPDLFHQEELADLRDKYPRITYDNLADTCWWAQVLFNWGKFKEPSWGNAEEFIDIVDCSDSPSAQASMLVRMNSVASQIDEARNRVHTDITPPRFADLTEMKLGLMRALAAECSWFAKRPQSRPERWGPYERWLESLDPEYDTIVSFNYDQVLESLRSAKRLAVVLPHESVAPRQDSIRLLKLHGSVTWFLNGETCESKSVDEVLGSPGGYLALGTPGRTKRHMKDRLFEPLWAAAETAIQSASAIVLLGYRFPESDGDARRRILASIGLNSTKRLICQVVLGPNQASLDTIRASRMLEVCTRRSRIVHVNKVATRWTEPTAELFVEPLFAEDYLDLYADDGPLSRWT